MEKDSIDSVLDIKGYNDLLKLYRVTGYVLRFINSVKLALQKKGGFNVKYLTMEEPRVASLLWIWSNQTVLVLCLVSSHIKSILKSPEKVLASQSLAKV